MRRINNPREKKFWNKDFLDFTIDVDWEIIGKEPSKKFYTIDRNYRI